MKVTSLILTITFKASAKKGTCEYLMQICLVGRSDVSFPPPFFRESRANIRQYVRTIIKILDVNYDVKNKVKKPVIFHIVRVS